MARDSNLKWLSGRPIYVVADDNDGLILSGVKSAFTYDGALVILFDLLGQRSEPSFGAGE